MYAKILGVLAALSLGIAGYYYVTNLQDDIKSLTTANTKYELVVDELRFSLETIQDDITLNKERMEKLNEGMIENSKLVTDTRVMLSKHDLRKIIQRKPQWFEKIAQKGTDKYYNELKEATEWENP